MAAEEYAANYKAVMLGTSQRISDTQAETTATLESAWKQAEHAYATGVIATEAELYRQKSALLEQYGNADLEDHWRTYTPTKRKARRTLSVSPRKQLVNKRISAIKSGITSPTGSRWVCSQPRTLTVNSLPL